MSSIVLLHFLFRSSVTPTRNVEYGPGVDSPAELFSDPAGTFNAGSFLASFCIGVCASLSVLGAAEGDEVRCNDCLALDSISLALRTPLLLLFLSPDWLVSSTFFFVPWPAPVFAFLSPSFEDSLVRRGLGCFEVSVDPGDIAEESSLLLEAAELPNILFRSPPWPEKLLRLFPARLK